MLFVATIPIPSHPESPLHESTSLSSRSAPRILSLRHSLAQNQRKSPLLDGAKRFYLETVPYTKRTHFVLLWSSLEKQLGESNFKTIKSEYKGKIVPPLHPESIRLQKIAQDIVEAVQKGLRKEQVWTDIATRLKAWSLLRMLANRRRQWENLRRSGLLRISGVRRMRFLMMDGFSKVGKRVKKLGQSLKHNIWRDSNGRLSLLMILLWMLFCLPGGKIVVFTGLLNHFRADAEIATIIGMRWGGASNLCILWLGSLFTWFIEDVCLPKGLDFVAHVVARHAAENISKNVWLTILQLILYQFFMPDVVNTMSNLFLRLPFSRSYGDGVGSRLHRSASAGYDPRVAPQVYDKLEQVGGSSKLQDYLATHPSGKKRAKLLSEAKVMEGDHGSVVDRDSAVEAAGEHYAVEIGAAAVERPFCAHLSLREKSDDVLSGPDLAKSDNMCSLGSDLIWSLMCSDLCVLSDLILLRYIMCSLGSDLIWSLMCSDLCVLSDLILLRYSSHFVPIYLSDMFRECRIGGWLWKWLEAWHVCQTQELQCKAGEKQKSLSRRGCRCVCNCPECREITQSVNAMSEHWKTVHGYNGDQLLLCLR
ncbi:hypothetical protein SASPL_128922 [Salvia splendens]|uniref:Peptidase M48 domain-containing protein n=1 Tax=Salvia splendens TaxID=180675 RepID=A0A8X8XG73_SALSN|nr:hypothetical protein SASPL_128922 [Salvia splendens]